MFLPPVQSRLSSGPSVLSVVAAPVPWEHVGQVRFLQRRPILYEYKEETMENEVVADVVTPKYKPLSNEQKYAVRDAQFQLANTKEQAQNAINLANQNLISVIEKIGIEAGLTAADKVEFQLVTLEFTDKK